MSTKRFNPEQIVNLLRKIEVELANGKATLQAALVSKWSSPTKRNKQRFVLMIG